MRARRDGSKRVVVLGMGDTGTLVAGRLASRFHVTGIATTPMFVSGQELGARLARPDLWRRDYLHEYGAFRRLDHVDVVHGAATSVDLGERRVNVRSADGSERALTYEALVVATGATNGFWRSAEVRSRADVLAADASWSARLAAAQRVVVVGGGPSGVNVASQVADTRPDADVTLVHSDDLPLASYHPRTRARVARQLVRQGVVRVAGRRATVPPGAAASLGSGPVALDDGRTLDADVVLWAIGSRTPNTSVLPDELLDGEGYVRVRPTFQTVARDEVFAIGDVAATDPLRSSARNFGSRLAARNVAAFLDGRPNRMRRFRPPRHRWGSITGLQHEGIRIHSPRGWVTPLRPWFADRVLFPWLTHRLIYGGIRPSARGSGGDGRSG